MNLIAGVQDKSDSGLRRILFAQAKVRLVVAIPVIICDLALYLSSPGGVPIWFLGIMAGYCGYALAPYRLITRSDNSALQFLLLATAVLDPLVLSVWIALTGVYGSLIAGFYLFTTLGFGFRTGRPLMHICQITSIAGFMFVLAVDPYWQNNAVVWAALLVPLIVVPMYASALLKTVHTAREHAEEQSRAKSQLLAKVSHELRTPLTGIVASAELLAVETSDAAVARRTKTILTLSDNLLCEINDLLDQAKFEAGTVALDYSAVDLHRQIGTLRNTFETMAARKGLAFHAEVDAEIRDAVEIDAHQFDRILLNLISNAIKFTETGSVRLAVELLDSTAADYRLRFSVVDTGIGIPESFREKMFEPFSQADQSIGRQYGGTGLGLALSKRIIELMRGELSFASTPGHGTRFWFELSLKRTTAPAASAQALPAHVICGKRVLVADDNASNLILLKELLELDQHEVAICSSGSIALEVLARRDFDVLLLDYNLGDMDGIRVLQTYRFGRLHPAPALFLTADATIQTATRLQDAGAAGVLYKPVTLAGIREALAGLGFSAEPAPSAGIPAPAAKTMRPALSVVSSTPLDGNVITELRKLNTRPAFLPRLLGQAEIDIQRCCEQLLDALAGRNYVALRAAAHALKGVSVNVGAMRLSTLATTLMKMPSEEFAPPLCDRLATDIRDSSRATMLALRKAIASESANSTKDFGLLHPD